ncbi:metalloregulator ArsR/SmtB family transcription factor [bacterium]|nr:metalloregulator ArsR/SmtB family transcription factor [bacterium]MDB9845262.1 metalloregulator ArsR/SmtB family transcription factor [Acidimicrobiales bacterium]
MAPLEVISEPRRREILARLGELGESPVGALAELIDISRPAVSQHLKVLKDAGMVDEHQQGRQRLYRLNAEGIAKARLAIELFLINELNDLETSARDLSTRRVTDG